VEGELLIEVLEPTGDTKTCVALGLGVRVPCDCVMVGSLEGDGLRRQKLDVAL